MIELTVVGSIKNGSSSLIGGRRLLSILLYFIVYIAVLTYEVCCLSRCLLAVVTRFMHE